MSDTAEKLHRQLADAKDLQSVVRSMKALAAASITQYQKSVLSLTQYYRTLELGLIACLHDTEHSAHVNPSLRSASIGVIVFGSDQGLVGRFNEVVVDFTTDTFKTLVTQNASATIAKIWAVGERTQVLLAESQTVPVELLAVPTSVESIAPLIDEILIAVAAAHASGDITALYVFHNHPRHSADYDPVAKQLLPLDISWQRQLATKPWPTRVLPQVIDGVLLTLPTFLNGYLFVLLYQACAESLASENASRLASMQRAEKNIEDMTEQLNLKLHRVRQQTIDEELFDVIAGYEALTRKHKRSR